MAKGKIYEYAVVYHPKATKDTAGNDTTPPSKQIVPNTSTLAISEKEVGIKASRAIPAEYDDRLEDCEVFVRPF
jgi:hypothetical protein